MTLLQAEMEELARLMEDVEPTGCLALYGEERFGAGNYWGMPRVHERLAGALLSQVGAEQCVFGVRAVLEENEHGAMIRPPGGPPPQGDECEVMWLLAIHLSEGVEIGVVRHTSKGWGELRICADQVQLTPEAPGYWLMQEMLREEA